MSNYNFIKAFKAIQENKNHEIELSSNEITELKSINESFIELLGNTFYYGYYRGVKAQELKNNMIMLFVLSGFEQKKKTPRSSQGSACLKA